MTRDTVESGSTAVTVTSRRAAPEATASVCSPNVGPSVHTADARPEPSLHAESGRTDPPPGPAENVTSATATGSPSPSTAHTSTGSDWPATAVSTSHDRSSTVATAEASAVAVTSSRAPPAVTSSRCSPGVLPSVHPTAAQPSRRLRTLSRCTDPLSGTNLTRAPSIGRSAPSNTRTPTAAGRRCPANPL